MESAGLSIKEAKQLVSAPVARAEGRIDLLRRESAALTSHGVHYRLSRRLSDLSIEPGQLQECRSFGWTSFVT
jgi:hypothetical protein